MHWTAFLAYRRFPAHARVADDLPCAGCGYNLRSARANGNCPECGKAVGDSLFVLNQPEIVGRSLRTIGKTHLGFLALLLGCLTFSGQDWPVIVAFGILSLLAIVRVMAVGELRYRGAIDSLPIVGSRLKLWWWVCIVETIITCATCVIMWLNAKFMFVSAVLSVIAAAMFIAWLVACLVETLLAGWFGTSLATMLYYTFARWEFIGQRVGLAAFALLVPLFILAISAGANPNATIAMLALCYLVFALGMIATAAGLTHLGNGAEVETDTWEGLIDTNPGGQYSRPSDTSKPEPPPIKLERSKPEG